MRHPRASLSARTWGPPKPPGCDHRDVEVPPLPEGKRKVGVETTEIGVHAWEIGPHANETTTHWASSMSAPGLNPVPPTRTDWRSWRFVAGFTFREVGGGGMLGSNISGAVAWLVKSVPKAKSISHAADAQSTNAFALKQKQDSSFLYRRRVEYLVISSHMQGSDWTLRGPNIRH